MFLSYMHKMEEAVIRLATRVDKPWMWIAISALILLIDFFTGPYINFPVFFVIPVALACWHRGHRWIVLAVVLPLVRLSYSLVWSVPWTFLDALANFCIRTLVLVLIASLTSRLAKSYRELAKEVKLLEGILPICSYCKKIRNDGGKWEQLEQYISKRSEAKFSHSICPPCQKQYFGDLLSGN